MYKTTHDWAGKVIHLELSQKFKFYYPNKWYIHNSEFVLENDTPKVLWDFEIQTDHLSLARRLDLVIVKKEKNLSNCGLYRSGRPRSKFKGKRKER